MSQNADSSRTRVHVLATLGAQFLPFDIRYKDQHALRAVLHMPLSEFLFASCASGDPHTISVGDAIAQLVQTDFGPLSVLGEAVLFQWQEDRYRADCESWEAQPDEIKLGSWRNLHPTRDQWMRMSRTAQELAIDLPGEVTRGEAHDWIKATGGNRRYNTEKK